MEKSDKKYKLFIDILNEELLTAMGCTEPIALAFASATARDALGCIPDKVVIKASGSMIKNSKSVIVPNTNHMKGMEAAAAIGIIAGDANRKLEVIANVTEDQKLEMEKYLAAADFSVEHIEDGHSFDIIIVASKDGHTVTVRLADYHTNIVLIEKDGEVIFEKNIEDTSNSHVLDRSYLTMENIYDFATTVDIADVKDILEKQIKCNIAIAEEGILGNYGSNIGSILLNTYGHDVKVRARAMAAAGSDARMNGCEMPVVINSGSGNQGITVCVPVVEYAKEYGCSKDQLYRALVVSNLCAVHIKTGIGTLSAFCGAVSAGAAAGAGIAYLLGENLETISATLVNALACAGGIFCDGAKASCASKIAAAVDAAITGYNMHKTGNDFLPGDGIVMDSADETVAGIGRIGKDGMLETNNVIIDLMIQNSRKGD